MKKILFVLVVLGCLHDTMAQSRKEQQVTMAVTRLTQAMVSADRAVLESMIDEHLSYGHSSGQVDDRKEFLEKLASGRSDFVNIELSEQAVTISGRNAIVRHTLKAKTLDRGNPGEVQLRVLLVWKKKNGKWKLLARQAVK